APEAQTAPEPAARAPCAGRADEAKPRNQPQAAAAPPMRETAAQGALLKSAIDAPVVLVSGPGVSIRRNGVWLERSTDNGATWALDLVDAPAGLHVGSCPT